MFEDEHLLEGGRCGSASHCETLSIAVASLSHQIILSQPPIAFTCSISLFAVFPLRTSPTCVLFLYFLFIFLFFRLLLNCIYSRNARTFVRPFSFFFLFNFILTIHCRHARTFIRLFSVFFFFFFFSSSSFSLSQHTYPFFFFFSSSFSLSKPTSLLFCFFFLSFFFFFSFYFSL